MLVGSTAIFLIEQYDSHLICLYVKSMRQLLVYNNLELLKKTFSRKLTENKNENI